MIIKKYSLGSLQANCYFLIEENDLILIDPGDDASFILEEIQRQRLNLKAIFATHGHFDHIGAVGEIQQSFNVPFYINEKDLFLVKRLNETAKYFLGYNPYFLPINYLKNFPPLPRLRWASKLKIIYSPGHTPGSVCFYFEDEKIIFTGDTLFKDGIGRYDFSYSDKKKLFESLKKILSLPDETIIYPGHGEETTVGIEKINQPFS
jgi:glyoxylase-like metal-dependent hydrolase (beta-lactamase superfamily II)